MKSRLMTAQVRFMWPCVLAAFALAACGESHAGDSGVTPDSGSDIRATDVRIDSTPPCPDADRDGFLDVRCGGDDSDDTDPSIHPNDSECTAPDRVRACIGGEITESDCPLDAPVCDQRIGTCATTACGDGVLHGGGVDGGGGGGEEVQEECDDGNESEEDLCDNNC